MTQPKPAVSPFGAQIQCGECEVFIGVGHHDAAPLRAPDGRGQVCRACHAALLRQWTPNRPVDWGKERAATAEVGPEIVVCEDDPMVASLLRDVLAIDGHRVRIARDGEAALRLAAERRPAALTLDLDLPGLDGPAVLARLKADPVTARIPVIVVSGRPGWLTPVDRQQAAAVLTKPSPPWELRAAVERAIGGSP